VFSSQGGEVPYARCPLGDHDSDGLFAPLLSKGVFAYVKLLLVGTILAPGECTVTVMLRILGKSADAHFQNYHRVLNRAQ
jgi:hypothetical protein